MKKDIHILLILIFLISIGISSCTGSREKKDFLYKAEVLMKSSPDSALSILQSIQQPEKMSEADYAKWCLLKTQADDKNFIQHTSDSIISVAVKYYAEVDSVDLYSTALYYRGRVLQDLGDEREATELFVKAMNMGEAMKDRHQYFIMVSRLGTIYAHQGILDKALNAYTIAYQTALSANDSVDISYALSYQGRVYGVKEDWEKSYNCYKNAIEMATHINARKALSLAFHELAATYIYNNQYQEAEGYIESYRRMNKDEDNLIFCLTLGDFYRSIGKEDDAAYFLIKALESDNIYTSTEAAHSLYYLYELKRDYEKAISYNNIYWNKRDSIYNLENVKAIAEAEGKYNNEKITNEKIRIELNNSKLLNLIFIILICGITLSILIGKLYYRRKREISSLKENLIQLNRMIELKEQRINENDSSLARLSEELKEKEEVYNILKNSSENRENEYNELLNGKKNEIDGLRTKYENITQENILLKLKIEEEKAKIEDFGNGRNMDSLINLLKCKNKAIQEYEWKDIYIKIDQLYDNFNESLKEKCPDLTSQEIRLCVLMKLQFSDEKISTLLGIEKESVTKRKQRLRSHLNPKKSWKKGELQSMINRI